MKPIRLSAHAQSYAWKRGFTETQVKQAIQNSPWSPADMGRLECRMNFAFGQEWNGKVYPTQQIRPIFVEDADEILVITVYTYYF